MEAPRGAREPTGTNWPTLNNNTPITGETQNKHSSSTTVRITTNPHPPNTRGNVEKQIRLTNLRRSRRGGNARHPFRTRKLSPTAPMVLHLGGCGRVGHRRNTTTHGPLKHTFEGAKQHPQTQHTIQTTPTTQHKQHTTNTHDKHTRRQTHENRHSNNARKQTHNIHTSTTRQQRSNDTATTLVLVKEITPKTVQGLTLVPLFP